MCVGVLWWKYAWLLFISVRWFCDTFEAGLFDFEWTYANLTRVKSNFSCKTIFPALTHRTRLVSKDVEFYCASFDISEKFVASCPPMDTPTQKVKNEFSGRNSQGIYPNLDYFGMILKALQTLLFKIKIHPSLKKTPKILGIQPTHGLYDMVHMIRSIWYGPYDMAHMMWSI